MCSHLIGWALQGLRTVLGSKSTAWHSSCSGWLSRENLLIRVRIMNKYPHRKKYNQNDLTLIEIFESRNTIVLPSLSSFGYLHSREMAAPRSISKCIHAWRKNAKIYENPVSVTVQRDETSEQVPNMLSKSRSVLTIIRGARGFETHRFK